MRLSNNDLYFEGWWCFPIYRLGKKSPRASKKGSLSHPSSAHRVWSCSIHGSRWAHFAVPYWTERKDTRKHSQKDDKRNWWKIEQTKQNPFHTSVPVLYIIYYLLAIHRGEGIPFFSRMCVYSLQFQNRGKNNAVVPQPYLGFFMSCIAFKLPSGIAVVGVPLQLFLLAVCWQNSSCYCFTRIDFHRTAPSKAYLQATTLQQNINAVSFSAFLSFQKEKKKHFQQSSIWDAIYSGHIEDMMLVVKGLNLSSISPSPTNRQKKNPAPRYHCARHKIWKFEFVYYIKGFREGPHFAVVGRWDVFAHMCHLKLADSEKELRSVTSFQALFPSLLLNLPHDQPQ